MKSNSNKIHKKKRLIKKSKKYLGGSRLMDPTTIDALFATAKRKAIQQYGSSSSSASASNNMSGDDSPIPFIDLTPELRRILNTDLVNTYPNPIAYSVVIEKYSWLDKSNHDCLMNIINAFFNVEICALANGNPGQKRAAQSFNRDHYQRYNASVMVDRTLSTTNWQNIADWFTGTPNSPVSRPDEKGKSKAKATSHNSDVFIADLKGSTIMFDVTNIKLGKDMIGAHVVPIKFIALFIKFLKKIYSEKRGTNHYDECFNNLDEKCTVIPATAAVNDDDDFLTREGCLSGYLILYNLLYTLGDSCYRIISDAIVNFGNDALRCMGLFDGIFGVIVDSSPEYASTSSDPFIEKVSFIPTEKESITNAYEQLQSKVVRDRSDASLLSCILESFGDPFACNTEQSVLEIVINLDKNIKDPSYDSIKRKVVIKDIAEPRSRIGYKTLSGRRGSSIMASELEMFYRANFNILFRELIDHSPVKLLHSVKEIKQGILENFKEGIKYLTKESPNGFIKLDVLNGFIGKLKCSTFTNAMASRPQGNKLSAAAYNAIERRIQSRAEKANEHSQNEFAKPPLTKEQEKKIKIATDIIIKLSGGNNGSFSSYEQSLYYAKLIQKGTVRIEGKNAIYFDITFEPPPFTRPMAILSSDFITSLLGQIDSKVLKLRRSKKLPEDTSDNKYVCDAVNKIFDINSIEYRICLIELYNEFVTEDAKE